MIVGFKMKSLFSSVELRKIIEIIDESFDQENI